jgi:hypothetical protein
MKGKNYGTPHYAFFSILFVNFLFFLYAYVLLFILFSNTLNLCTSLQVRAQVSHPYERAGKVMVLYINL